MIGSGLNASIGQKQNSKAKFNISSAAVVEVVAPAAVPQNKKASNNTPKKVA